MQQKSKLKTIMQYKFKHKAARALEDWRTREREREREREQKKQKTRFI